MKTINYTGSSKLISRIVHLLNRKAPLPLDGQGDAVWGTNGQVLTTDGQGNTSWTTPQGGGGDVTDVEVNGTSVVNAQGVAEVSVPTATSDLNNDSGFIDGTDLSTALSDYTPTSSLATVATSGDYDDLTNKPTIPAAQVQSDWSQADNTQVDYIKNKPSIPTALADLTDDSTHRTVTDTQISTWNGKSDFSGSYNDLTDKPTIPTVNDGTLTIQQNGTTLGTFSANQSGNTTVNLTGGGGSTYTEGDGIDISAQDVISVDTTFTEASTRTNIASGDTFSTILGKIKKFFTDLKTVAFTGSYNDLSNKPTIPADNSVKDYNNNTPTKFGYSTSGMAQADAVWLGAWDASASGEYRLRAVQQANLKVAEATKATQDGSGNTITSTYVKKSGDTMTGNLVLTGTTYLAGEAPNGTTTNHALLMGHAGQDYWRFYEYGGVFTFYKSQSGTNTKLGEINANGWEGNVKGDVTGNASSATKATQDGDGSTITSTYLKLSGGTMTGQIVLSASGYRVADNIGYSVNRYGNFVHLQAGSTNYWAIVSASSSELFRVYFDSGKIHTNGSEIWTNANGTLCVQSSSSWLNLEADSQIQCRNRADNAWVPLATNRIFLKYGSTQSGTVEVQSDSLTISEDRGNGIALRGDSGIYCRRRGTDASWSNCYANAYPGTGSSRRLKENIKPMTEEEAEKILQIETVTFDYKETHISDKSRFNRRGVIAEDVEMIIPSAVIYDKGKNGEEIPQSVDYMRFVPYLIKMVQMQQSEIDTLKNEIAELKGAIK